MKIGVYLCQCGGNISNTVDLEAIQKHIEGGDEIAVVRQESHLCSGAGQKAIIDDIGAFDLDRVVIASCSPQFHEKTFRGALSRAGLNPYMLEIANFREHCSWAHKDNPEAATIKATDLLDASIGKVRHNVPLEEKMMKMGDDVLVIGGGIAGIQTALDLADSGKNVTLVERQPTIGGNMALLTKTFPTEDCASCILSPKMAEVEGHPKINLIVDGEIESIKGHRLHFEAKIKHKPRYISPEINMDECIGCAQCEEACPVSAPNHWEQGVVQRKAIYIPAPHAIPYKYIIDKEICLHDSEGCTACFDVCPQKAMVFDQEPEYTNVAVDAVVVATGYDIFDSREKPVFGYGEFENVVNGLEMERIVDHITEKNPPRDVGKRVAFIQCVGSRDEQVGREYCSRVCCMYSTKLASLLKQARPDTDIYIFYTDLRAFGKGFEEYYKRAQKMGIKFIRGKPAEFKEDPKTKLVTVLVEDTLSRDIIEAEFDLVVLAAGLTPAKSTDKIAEHLKLAVSDDGFLKEAHPKYRPVDTLVEGVFLAGTVQGPKDIPDTVAQGSAAAGRVIATLAKGEFAVDPMLAFVHDDKCTACGACYDVCPLNAIAKKTDGKAEIKETLCVGCGACLGACPEEAIDLNGFTNMQLYSAVEAALAGKKPGEKRALVFGDSNCTYRVADAAGVRKMKYANDNRVLMVPSSCRITPNLVAFAFAKGADIVLIGDCPEKGNKFEWAHDFAKKYIEQAKQILADKGVETDRIVFDDFTASNLPKFVETMNALSEKMKKLPDIDSKIRADLNPLER